ncbi:MAG: thiamine-binding protein [Paludibacter sp.]|nr:thiamine-binding protein [Paludibacter sp.]
MNNTVNIALQILPTSKTVHPYSIVDAAIAVIAASGLKYRVTPFETVMEGNYDRIMEVVKLAQQACYDAGAENLMTYLKIQSNGNGDVSIEDKMGKYE